MLLQHVSSISSPSELPTTEDDSKTASYLTPGFQQEVPDTHLEFRRNIGSRLDPTLQPEPADQASIEESFLGIDIVAGANSLKSKLGETNQDGTEVVTSLTGFEVGATVRFFPWLGIAGRFARNGLYRDDDLRLNQYLVGVEFSVNARSPSTGEAWLKVGPFAPRVGAFAHVLAGAATASYPDLPPERGSEFVVGGGVDIGFIRFELDYVRLELNGFPTNSWRWGGAAIFPFCLKGCGREKP